MSEVATPRECGPVYKCVAGLVKVSFHKCLLPRMFEYESTNRAEGQKRGQLMSSMIVAVQVVY